MMEEIKKERIDLSDLYPTIAAVLEKGGEFLIYPNGVSMLPTLRPGKDAVYLSPPTDLKCGEMILYKRANGAFVLHRIVKIAKNGTFVLRGDNQYYDEANVSPSQVIAAVRRYTRGTKEIDCSSAAHKAYLFGRKATFPFRKFFFRLKRRLERRKK